MRRENNSVKIIGTINNPLAYSHTSAGEKFYKGYITTRRTSGAVDNVPLLISEVFDVNIGNKVCVNGELRTHNIDGKLLMNVFIQAIKEVDVNEEDDNIIEIDGYICKKVTYRKTPSTKREVADVIVAVNRIYGKSDYIPCICWGRIARAVKKMEIGCHLSVRGRIQSRKYQKNGETKITYEVSVIELD